MTERYKVRGAMLALQIFTVEDLSLHSGVNESTVRSIINRSSDLLQEVERIPTGRRGGRRLRYRVQPEKMDALRSELTNAFDELRAVTARPLVQSELPSPPLALLAVESALEKLKSPSGDETPFLLKKARLDAAAAAQELLAMETDPLRQQHAHEFQRRLSLCETSLDIIALEARLPEERCSLTARQVIDRLDKLARDSRDERAALWESPQESAMISIDIAGEDWSQEIRRRLGSVDGVIARDRTVLGEARILDDIHVNVGRCVLFVNSAKQKDEVIVLARNFFAHKGTRNQIYILDAALDADIQNMVYAHKSFYVPAAVQLDEEATEGLLGRASRGLEKLIEVTFRSAEVLASAARIKV